MSETAEQIQDPILPEPLVVDVPAPSLTEIPPQAPAPEPEILHPAATSPDESVLTSQIVQLWLVHQDCQSAIKQETQQFRSLRSELGKRLHQMKALLARPGRSGGWSAWLKERRIPRATADRLVTKFERSLNPDGNCLTAQFTEPTDQEIQSLLDKLLPKLRRVLKTPASAYRFLDLLSSSFALIRKDTEEGLVVVKPGAHVAVEQSPPAEAQAEPVPVTADVPAESIVESTGVSLAL